MSHTCGACNGSGECQNDYHDPFRFKLLDGIEEAITGELDVCPACGKYSERGNCSVCGGSGEQDD